jgi:hypothetical protein
MLLALVANFIEGDMGSEDGNICLTDLELRNLVKHGLCWVVIGRIGIGMGKLKNLHTFVAAVVEYMGKLLAAALRQVLLAVRGLP